MARRGGVDQKIQVTRGFVTEFTALSFPEDAAIDVDNCIIDPDGSVRRRPGLDLEQQWKANSIDGGVLVEAALPDLAFSTHLWEFVANSGTLNIVVQQIGAELQFYAQVGAISQSLLGTLDMSLYAVDLGELKRNPVQVASGLGNLYVVNPYMEPVRVSYDGTSFTAIQLDIQIRDMEGLDDSLEIQERPTSLTRNHYYNLRNQGWTDANILKFTGLAAGTDLCAGTGAPGGLAAGTNGDFPSNADNMSVGIVTNASGNLVFDHTFVRESNLGNTPAPKGHFILNAFNKDYDTALGCPGTGFATFATRPESVAFHQGRAFYTSPNTQNVVGGVFYSRQLTEPDIDGECFQQADPTADEINDLVDTDGGFLPMPGVGEIYTLKEIGGGVAAIASNGVWFISGAEIGSALTATSLRLSKVSKVGALGPKSVVEAEGSLFYFGIDGIIQLTSNEIGLDDQNLTQNTIQSFYVSISADARRDAASVYIPEQRKIYWAYRDVVEETSPTNVTFNKFLILDFDIRGFYKYSIAEDATQNFPEIVGLTLIKPLTSGTAVVPVLELDGTNVTELDGVTPVTEEVEADSGQITQLKAATLVYSTVDAGYKFTFSTFHSRSFTDWWDTSTDGIGIPMSSYIEFAEFNMGAFHVKGTPRYVHTFFQHTSKNLEPGGYYQLPPLYYQSTGVRVSQSVLEVLNRPSSNLRASQSVTEVLMKAPSDFRASQSITEVLYTL
jgi:hypothetical protein